ncbi:30S ribosomal protein S20 [Candidatus Bealeia paramacronuclearis]|uniref:Small ribosomal subunit protein bS20 n=1 Tax=Candidatus Bealeia paramacronuclearis TaxID=1921001 RepID=A0ABZ2C5G8_9PROT|nr:30S ribosomal protein S20 [Candidatus Bealeia paramacronuclearis]
MAHHQSAIKRIRRDTKVKLRNHARISRIRTFVKKVEIAISTGNQADAKLALQEAQSELLSGVTKGVLHLNTASRKISRLSSRVSQLA